MVEVTRSNFEEILLLVEKSVKKAAFIALDTEFTGLSVSENNNLSLFDSMQQIYSKLRCRASSFIPCQIGLSIFTKHESENKYLVETYVFYVRPTLCGTIDKRFMIQASSLDFLSAYDFDFNKCMKEGIPYLNEIEEQQVLKGLEDGSLNHPHEKMMDIRLKKEQDVMVNKIFNTILEEHNSHLPCDLSTEEKPLGTKVVLQKDKVCHEYFQINELRHKYPSLWAYSAYGMIIVEKVSPRKRRELEKNISQEKARFLEFSLGFTRVFRLLKDSKKPILGHNLLMDLLLFFHNFHQPLPKSYKLFKKELHSVFPVLYDTRHIWRNVKKFYKLKDIPKQCGLFDLYEMFVRVPDCLATLYSPDIQHSNGEKYSYAKFPHESGYDSFITGWVFLKICHVLAMNKIKSSVLIQPQSTRQHFNAVTPFVNKLNLGCSAISYINLDGEDPLPVVPGRLHISVKNKAMLLNCSHISQLFGKYGMIDIKVMGSKREAVIAVGSRGCYKDILKSFEKNADFVVMPYNVFKHSLLVNSALWLTAAGSGCVVAFLVFKLISSP